VDAVDCQPAVAGGALGKSAQSLRTIAFDSIRMFFIIFIRLLSAQSDQAVALGHSREQLFTSCLSRHI